MLTSKQIMETAVKAIDSKKGRDIKALYIRELSTVADYFVLCTANSPTQIKAISDEIERLWNEGDFEAYTLKVHSLKSMARLIGANLLSSLAADLEYAGKHGDTETIKEKTPMLLSKYRAYAKYLSRLMDEDAAEEDRA